MGFRIARWLYRRFFERRLWWFMGILKQFFFAETLQRLSDLESRTKAMQEQLWKLEWNMTSQWDPIEQLLLALLRHAPESSVNPQPGGLFEHPVIAETDEVNHVNGPNTIR